MEMRTEGPGATRLRAGFARARSTGTLPVTMYKKSSSMAVRRENIVGTAPIIGGSAPDEPYGGEGDDELRGGPGNDLL